MLREEYTATKRIKDCHFVLVENLTRKIIIGSWLKGSEQECFEYENLPNYWRFCIHPDEQIQVEKYFKESNLLRQFEQGIHDVSFLCRLIDHGKERWMQYEIHMLQEPINNEVLLYVYAKDMSKEKEAEEKQKQKEKKYNSIIEALGGSFMAIYSANLEEDTYESVKAAAGYEKMPFTKESYSTGAEKYIHGLLHPDDKARYQRIFSIEALRRQMQEGVKKIDFECRQKIGGEYQWIIIQALFTPVDNESGVIFSICNIHELKMPKPETEKSE